MKPSAIPKVHAEFERLSKGELYELAEDLLKPETWIVEKCVQFVIAETQGLWHGRARAKMCRRLKHCELGRSHKTDLVNCITNRLFHGTFSEQFKDQLKLAILLDSKYTLEVSERCLKSEKTYVKRYAKWVLSHSPNPTFKRDS